MSVRLRIARAGTASAVVCLWGCAAPPLPPATGSWNDLLLISESPTGGGLEALCAVLESPVPDLVPEEPRFRVLRQPPAGSGARMVRDKNVAVVDRSDPPGPWLLSLRSALRAADAARLDAGGAAWCVLRDVWARGQEVSVLFAPSAVLDSLLVHTAVAMRSRLEQSSLERASDAARVDTTTARARALHLRHGFVIAVPDLYRVEEHDTLAAVELVGATPTRSVTVFWRDGADAPAAMPPAALLSLQQQILAGLHGDSLAVHTCRLRVEAPAARLVLRGMWENRAEIAAGPLVTYFVYDAPRRRLYGVQGQLFAPGRRKRSPQIELEALMSTFRLETMR